MLCQYCEQEIDSTEEFCPYCDFPVDEYVDYGESKAYIRENLKELLDDPECEDAFDYLD